jgi:flagellar biosynthesis/type III secretory pathway protein FliH
MRHEKTIRFGRPLRAVRLTDASASEGADLEAMAEASARALTEMAAAKEREQQKLQEQAAVEQALAGIAEAASGLTHRRNDLLAEMQKVAVELAMAVATRVTYDKLQSDHFAIEELVHAVVSRLAPAGPVQIRMHPDDIALLNRRLGDERLSAGRFAEHSEIRLIPDESLRRGDCTADAGDVSFASSLEEQLSGIRQHLLRNLTDAQTERRKAAAGDRELRRSPDRRQTA